MSSLILTRRVVACFAVSMFLLSTLLVRPTHAATCTPTGFPGGPYNYTAAFVNPPSLPVGSVVDATGCDIGIYFSADGSVNGVEVFGATRYGIVNNGAEVDVTGSSIHGVKNGIYFVWGATGTIDANTVSRYEGVGIGIYGGTSVVRVTNNVVTGLGLAASYSGIQVAFRASGHLEGNAISGNSYGILGGDYIPIPLPAHMGATALIAENNNIHDNQYSIWIYGDDYTPPEQHDTCTTTQLTENNIHHSETGIVIHCTGWIPPPDPLMIEDNNIHHNTFALRSLLFDPDRTSMIASLNHLHQNEHDTDLPPA